MSDSRTIRAGFIPLVDAAILIAAREQGFAARAGLHLELIKQVSWSNIRDRLALGQFDIAHMLSPMPVAAALGLGSNPDPTITPFALGLGGNAITVATGLYRAMAEAAPLGPVEDALANARALAAVIRQRQAAGAPPLTFGMTYPFSSHNYELRYWMAAGGIDPDRDVTLIVVPPPLTAEALAAGTIDGFCVGAPWNMIAVDKGCGRIVATKHDIWAEAPEKVIGLRPDWAARHPDELARLLLALDQAAQWCDAPENRPALAAMLADPAYIGGDPAILRRILTGEFQIDGQGLTRQIPDYITFHRHGANRPDTRRALWLYAQMIRWGQVRHQPDWAAAAAGAYRPDLYRQILGGTDDDGVGRDNPAIDGVVFDPADLPGYLARFAICRHGDEGPPVA